MCAARVSSRARGVAVNVPARTIPLWWVTRCPAGEPSTVTTVSVSSRASSLSSALLVAARVAVMNLPTDPAMGGPKIGDESRS